MNGAPLLLVAAYRRLPGEERGAMLRTMRAARRSFPRRPLHIGVPPGCLRPGASARPIRRAYNILGGNCGSSLPCLCEDDANAILTDALADRALANSVAPTIGWPLPTAEGQSVAGRRSPFAALAGTRSPGPRKRLPLADRQRELPCSTRHSSPC